MLVLIRLWRRAGWAFCLACCLVFSAAGAAAQSKSATPIDIRLTEKDARSRALVATKPEYPSTARQLRVSGTVAVEVVVAADGKVEKVDVVSGHPLLVNSVKDALRRWRFAPSEVSGRPAILHFRLAFEFNI